MNYNTNVDVTNMYQGYETPGYGAYPNMGYQGMPYMPQGCGCGCQKLPPACPTYSSCNQVVTKCIEQDYPHITNYHTHVVDNIVRHHVNIPQYTSSENVQIYDDYIQGAPMIYPTQYGAPYNTYGETYGNTLGNTYGTTYGNTYGNTYGATYGPSYGNTYGNQPGVPYTNMTPFGY